MDLGTACAHTHHSTRSAVVASRIDTQTNRPIPNKDRLPYKGKLSYKDKLQEHTDMTSGSTEQCRAPTPRQRSQGGTGTPSTPYHTQLSISVRTAAYLWSLCRTDHAPVRVVQLAWPSQFTIPPDGGVEATEMGEGGCESETIQHLGKRRGGEGREER